MATLQHGGASLHYRVRGEGKPVVALHGSASTGAQWRTLTGVIGGRFKVITPDLPGYGSSAAGLRNGLVDDARAIAALVAATDRPVHLVGYSYGAAVALKLATLRPELLRSLTLIEPVSFHLLRHGSRSDHELYTDVAGLASRIFSHAIDKRPAEAMQTFVDYWSGEGAWDRSSRRLQAELLGHLPRVCADLRAVMFEHLTGLDLPGIACPTLVIEGADSPAVSRRLSAIVAGAIPAAVLRSVPEAGHLAPLTDPHLVDPMIADHLVATDRAAARQAA